MSQADDKTSLSGAPAESVAPGQPAADAVATATATAASPAATVSEARAATAKRDEPWSDQDLDALVRALNAPPPAN